MSDRDNITLSREVVEKALDALTGADDFSPGGTPIYMQEITALRAALAAEPTKPEPVAWMFVNLDGECEQIEYGTPPTDDDSITPLYIAPPEDEALRRDAERLNAVALQAQNAAIDLTKNERLREAVEAYIRSRLLAEIKAALRREDV